MKKKAVDNLEQRVKKKQQTDYSGGINLTMATFFSTSGDILQLAGHHWRWIREESLHKVSLWFICLVNLVIQ